jgi:primosomal protein N' (replication factor Y)
MFIVHVYPRMRGVAPLRLTYFSKTAYERGAVVTVTMRKKIEEVVVAQVEDAAHLRHTVKQLDHGLSAIKEQVPCGWYSETVMSTLETYARERAVSPGTLFHLFDYTPTQLPTTRGDSFHHVVLQKPRKERYEYYHQYIRSVFARGKSAVIIAPTAAYARMLFVELQLPHSFLLGVSDSKDVVALAEGRTRTSCVYIGPPSALLTEHANLDTVILESESSPYFDMDTRPFVFYPLLARLWAKTRAITLVSADTVPSADTAFLRSRDEITDALPPASMARSSAVITIVDMKHEAPKAAHLAPNTRACIARARAEKAPFVIVSGRRGLASHIVCGHCSTLLTCDSCASPIGLFGSASELSSAPRFYCRHCGVSRDSRELCRTCGSWKLVPLGTGSEGLEKDLVALFPDAPVVRIDAETAKGTKRIEAALLQGLADNAIIVGTERMVPYLPLSLPYMAMIGHDAHLSLPHFDANLALFRNGLELRERVTTALCIETRLPAHPVVTALRDGTVAVFLEQELAAREQFGFPPYKRYIEIASVGKKEAVQRTIASLMRVFSAYAPAPLPYGSGRERGSALILRPAVLDTPLRDLLCTLPPHVIVRVR